MIPTTTPRRNSLAARFPILLSCVLLATALPASAHEVSDAKSWAGGALHTTVFAAVVGGDRTVAVQQPVTIEGSHRGVLHLDPYQQNVGSAQVDFACELRTLSGIVVDTDSFTLSVTLAAPDAADNRLTSWSIFFSSPGSAPVVSMTKSPTDHPEYVTAEDSHTITAQ